MSKTFELPTEARKAQRVDPKGLILFGPPKSGKTTLVSMLPGCLILDLEDGSTMHDCMSISVENLSDLRTACTQIYQSRMAGEITYEAIAVDTVTRLEEWVEWEATEAYMKTLQGKKYNRYTYEDQDKGLGEALSLKPRSEWESVLNLPKGGGYRIFRDTFKKWFQVFEKLSDRIILVGHSKDKFIYRKTAEVQVSEIDLTGKNAGIAAGLYDSIGYVYHENDHTMISFDSNDQLAGSRQKHLRGQSIPVLDHDPESKEVIAHHWDRVYTQTWW